MVTSERSAADDRLRRRTLLARSVALRDMHDSILTAVATVDDGQTGHADIITARGLGILFKRYKLMCVLVARIVRGASWADIGDWLGVSELTATALFGDVVERWREGDPEPWAPSLAEDWRGEGGPPIDIPDDAASQIAAELGAYFARYTGAGVRACEWQLDPRAGHQPA